MGDDLFRDCDCGNCGDCNCDFDCCDCDCTCDDCLPGNNFIIICCCIPAATTTSNDPHRTNRANTSPDCFPCCCCCRHRSPRRKNPKYQKKKKLGFCCWRLWCCFARNDPSPPPSPPRRPPGPDYRRDGRYPMEDLDFYMNDRRRARDGPMPMEDLDIDMPPRGYNYKSSGGRYPMREEMRMYRDDEYYNGRGGRPDIHPKETSKDYRPSARKKSGMELDAPYYRDYDKRDKDGNHRGELDVAPRNERLSSPKELDRFRGDHPRLDKPDDGTTDHDTAHQGHQLQVKWSSPVKYEDPGRQPKS